MNLRNFALQRTNTILDFAHICARLINDETNVPQMLKNKAFRFGHYLFIA